MKGVHGKQISGCYSIDEEKPEGKRVKCISADEVPIVLTPGLMKALEMMIEVFGYECKVKSQFNAIEYANKIMLNIKGGSC